MLLAEAGVEQVADRPLRAGEAVDQGLELPGEGALAPRQALDHDRQESVARAVLAAAALENGARQTAQRDDLEPEPGGPDAGEPGEEGDPQAVRRDDDGLPAEGGEVGLPAKLRDQRAFGGEGVGGDENARAGALGHGSGQDTVSMPNGQPQPRSSPTISMASPASAAR